MTTTGRPDSESNLADGSTATVAVNAPRLLAVDDEPSIAAAIGRFAAKMGFAVTSCDSAHEALALLPELKPNVVIVDLRMPKLTGIDVLRAVQIVDPDCQVILMTGHATVDSAMEAVKAGALDYLSKPLDLDRLRELLISVREQIGRRERLLEVDGNTAKRFEFHGMVGRSPVMQQLFDSIRRLAPHVRTMLVTGETGTGKELVARALHKLGPRSSRRLTTVNCSAVVDSLFESELFGHVRGAFTGATDNKVGLFEHANGGTLFLDEVGELSPVLQAKLLRAVEHGEVQRVGSVDVRQSDAWVIAATNRDLQVEVAAGRFRADMLYRLSTMEIHLPPLRERREDIPYLTASFVRDCAARLNRPITGVSAAAEWLLQHAPWPGNIRQLRNVIERACILTQSKILSERELAAAMGTSAAATIAKGAAGNSPSSDVVSSVQREQIERVLQHVNGNKSAAARVLGMSRRSLYRLLDRLDEGAPKLDDAAAKAEQPPAPTGPFLRSA